MKPSEPPVVVEQLFDASVETVWNAITETSRMQQWFFNQLAEFEPEVGFETRFVVEHAGNSYVHLWKLTEVIPQQKIVYDWRYEGCPGRGLVTWELASDADKTRLTLTNTVLEEFPDSDPAFRRESCEAGWKYFINESLKSYLDELS